MFDESVVFLFLHLSASLLNITDSRYSQYDFLISFLYGRFEFGKFAFYFIVILFAFRGFDFLI